MEMSDLIFYRKAIAEYEKLDGWKSALLREHETFTPEQKSTILAILDDRIAKLEEIVRNKE